MRWARAGSYYWQVFRKRCAVSNNALPAWMGTVGVGFYTAYALDRDQSGAQANVPKAWKPPHRADLPTYSAVQVKRHSPQGDGDIWVTFRGAVYNIGEFHKIHPGGRIILQAAGGPLEPHWNRFAFHKNDEVFEMLEELRVGNLAEEDIVEYEADPPHGFLPALDEKMTIQSMHPLNAEPPSTILVEHFYTPVEKFFKRNHHEIPVVDASRYRLNVKTDCARRQFTLEELKKHFAPTSIVVTMQCAGNRRSDYATVGAVRGLNWNVGAIGNAKWTGVLLADVLLRAGVKSLDEGHVVFTGLDDDGMGNRYEASISLQKAIDPANEVLLAYEMNDQPLPKEHGFPLRVVVPGVVGARCVKWLGDIRVEMEESKAQWQLSDYKTSPPGAGWSDVDFTQLRSIQELPITSAICYPNEDQSFSKEVKELEVVGYAWSGGGRDVIRVEVSPDGGDTWYPAKLDNHIRQPLYRRWAWVFWSCRLPVPADHSGALQLVCKATDSSHNCQPESSKGIHNVRGLVNNSWHRVGVRIV